MIRWRENSCHVIFQFIIPLPINDIPLVLERCAFNDALPPLWMILHTFRITLEFAIFMRKMDFLPDMQSAISDFIIMDGLMKLENCEL